MIVCASHPKTVNPKHRHKYPEYVPDTVRLRADELLDGTNAEDRGWNGLLQRLSTEIHETEQAITAIGATEAAASAPRRKRLDAIQRTKELRDDIACLERLTVRHTPDLQVLYTLLGTQLRSAEQTWAFIYLAVTARVDCTHYRQILRSGREHAAKIVKHALELARLLDWYDENGVQAPDEFRSVRTLLREAAPPERDARLWHQAGGELLGTPLGSDDFVEEGMDDSDPEELDELPGIDIVEVDADDAQPVDHAGKVSYAWTVAPTLSDLLRALAGTAERFQPAEHGAIGAAVASRKNNPKYAYVRGFAALLSESGFAVSRSLERAIAIVSTIALNEKDTIVTEDDVRFALS